jgi:hypothetical protein
MERLAGDGSGTMKPQSRLSKSIELLELTIAPYSMTYSAMQLIGE